MAKPGKSKRPDKKIIMTAAKAKELQEQIYWELLEQFLAAAADLGMISEDKIEEFAARVNWYFSAQHNEKTINEAMVHAVISAKIGLIMDRTKRFSQALDINLMPPEKVPPEKPAAETEPSMEKIKAYIVEDKSKDNGIYTICFAKNANAAKYAAISSPILDQPRYTDLRARRYKRLDKAYRGYDEMDFTNARDLRAAKSAGIEFME